MNPALRLFRPVNAAMSVIGVIISAIVAVGTGFVNQLQLVILGSPVVFMVLSDGNIINDVFDSEIDRINHPERPIPSGKITKKTATYIYVFLYIGALVIAFLFLPLISFPVAVVAELLLIFYEVKGKKMGLPGNIIISALIGSIFLYGGLIFNQPERLLLMFLLAFLSNVSRELIKDVQDMEGDVDRKTFPKIHGKGAALNLSSAMIIATVAISFLPYLLNILSIYYAIAVVFCDISFVSTLFIQYRDVAKGQNLSKISMILGLASYMVGGIF